MAGPHSNDSKRLAASVLSARRTRSLVSVIKVTPATGRLRIRANQ